MAVGTCFRSFAPCYFLDKELQVVESRYDFSSVSSIVYLCRMEKCFIKAKLNRGCIGHKLLKFLDLYRDYNTLFSYIYLQYVFVGKSCWPGELYHRCELNSVITDLLSREADRTSCSHSGSSLSLSGLSSRTTSCASSSESKASWLLSTTRWH